MRKGNKDPSPMVQISIEDTTRESKVLVLNTSFWFEPISEHSV